jgi:hypothetical protein
MGSGSSKSRAQKPERASSHQTARLTAAQSQPKARQELSAGMAKDPEADFAASVLEAAQRELPEGSTWGKHGGHQLEPLFRHTRVIDARWLLRFSRGEIDLTGKTLTEYPSRFAVPAWQDCPTEAIVSLEDLRAARVDYDALPLAVLSYGWASRAHPDPTGEQCRKLVPILEAIVAWCDSTGGACKTWGIVWDFLSLPQRGRTAGYDEDLDDRTDEQRDVFLRGLSSINRWYGHFRTTTLVLDGPMPAGAPNKHPYGERGWCIFEFRLSALVKDNDCFLQLSRFSGRLDYWPGIVQECAARRPAPITPDAFRERVLGGMDDGTIRFTNGKDATAVIIPQYEAAFVRLMSEVSALDYEELAWGDEEARELAESIAYAHARGGLRKLRKLNLLKNKVGDDGLAQIARVIADGAMPNLTPKTCQVGFNPASKAAQDGLRAALNNKR